MAFSALKSLLLLWREAAGCVLWCACGVKPGAWQCPLLQAYSLDLQKDFRAYPLLLWHPSAFEGLGRRTVVQLGDLILLLAMETAEI